MSESSADRDLIGRFESTILGCFYGYLAPTEGRFP